MNVSTNILIIASTIIRNIIVLWWKYWILYVILYGCYKDLYRRLRIFCQHCTVFHWFGGMHDREFHSNLTISVLILSHIFRYMNAYCQCTSKNVLFLQMDTSKRHCHYCSYSDEDYNKILRHLETNHHDEIIKVKHYEMDESTGTLHPITKKL